MTTPLAGDSQVEPRWRWHFRRNMMMPRYISFGVMAAALASPCFAQAPLGAPLGGPAVPGICILSQQAVVTDSKVGSAAAARLRQLAEQAQAEITAERTPLENDARALEAQRASVKPAEFQQRQQAIGQRLQALQAKAQQRSREIEAARAKALSQIAAQVQPIIAATYKARSCGLLIDKSSIVGGNMTGDLTNTVLQALDAKITSVTIER